MLSALFSQAIVQSGSPLAFWAVHNDCADLHAQLTRCFSAVAELLVIFLLFSVLSSDRSEWVSAGVLGCTQRLCRPTRTADALFLCGS